MIPKIIHYCWFGGNPLPESAKKCIASWRKYLPDYEIKEWNESNFDVNIIPYTAEAYKVKKYAFVSDYARFWILYKYGGLYFDTDVEVIKNMDDIIAKGPFMGCEAGEEKTGTMTMELGIAPGLGIGANQGLKLYRQVLDWYEEHHFTTWLGVTQKTVVNIVSEIFAAKKIESISNGIYKVCGIYIYPSDYFCPLNYFTHEMRITDNTRSIHHYTATWVKNNQSVWEKICKRLNFIYVRLWVKMTNKWL